MQPEDTPEFLDADDEDISVGEEETEPSIRFTSQHIVDGLPITLTKTHTQHYELPHTYIIGHSLHTPDQNGKEIRVAHAESVLIEREEVLGFGEDEWFCHMDSESHDTLNLYEQVLGEDGGVQESIVSGDKRGSGVWGHELDDGAFLLIKDLYTHQDYRSRGLASWLLNQIVSTPDFAVPSGSGMIVTCPWVFAWPFPVESRDEQGETIVKQTFKTVGFSQVGTTSFWAYSLADDQHPSRQTPPGRTAPHQAL